MNAWVKTALSNTFVVGEKLTATYRLNLLVLIPRAEESKTRDFVDGSFERDFERFLIDGKYFQRSVRRLNCKYPALSGRETPSPLNFTLNRSFAWWCRKTDATLVRLM